MSAKIANTVCRNINCHKGKDGGRKKYYSCAYCLKTESWRTVACSPECYAEYIHQVRIARGQIKPERLDMSDDQIQNIVKNGDENKLLKESFDEISTILGKRQNGSIEDAVDAVNRMLDKREGGS